MTARFRQYFKSWSAVKSVIRWFDSDYDLENIAAGQTAEKAVDWLRVLPFAFLHLMCLAVIWVGWSWTAVTVAFALYVIRMFAITGFYHRYFSHKAFTTHRFWQFLFAVLGNASVQRGPLWWASHHRHHHRFADRIEDAHSPTQYGFWWSHIGWLTSRKNFPTKMKYVRDWARYPELVWINRFDAVIPALLAVFLFLGGVILAKVAPALKTNGMQMLIWGFFISTTVHFHATVTINSLAHMTGRRRYETADTSRNNFLLSIITLGEGWHNNHHHYPISARQGFYWWEIDLTYWGLVLLSGLGIIRDLRPLPEKVKDKNRITAVAQNG
jgi:stearoyl-CoA desaturase (delta-9 desaturase)